MNLNNLMVMLSENQSVIYKWYKGRILLNNNLKHPGYITNRKDYSRFSVSYFQKKLWLLTVFCRGEVERWFWIVSKSTLYKAQIWRTPSSSIITANNKYNENRNKMIKMAFSFLIHSILFFRVKTGSSKNFKMCEFLSLWYTLLPSFPLNLSWSYLL